MATSAKPVDLSAMDNIGLQFIESIYRRQAEALLAKADRCAAIRLSREQAKAGTCDCGIAGCMGGKEALGL